MKLIYTKAFMDDLIGTVEYIKRDSPIAAKSFERRVRNKIKSLKKFPYMGKAMTEPQLQGIRILIIGNYLAFYEVNSKEKTIYLHAFCHGAKDYPNMFKKYNRTP